MGQHLSVALKHNAVVLNPFYTIPNKMPTGDVLYRHQTPIRQNQLPLRNARLCYLAIRFGHVPLTQEGLSGSRVRVASGGEHVQQVEFPCVETRDPHLQRAEISLN